jgi:hypothetical protein
MTSGDAAVGASAASVFLALDAGVFLAAVGPAAVLAMAALLYIHWINKG